MQTERYIYNVITTSISRFLDKISDNTAEHLEKVGNARFGGPVVSLHWERLPNEIPETSGTTHV